MSFNCVKMTRKKNYFYVNNFRYNSFLPQTIVTQVRFSRREEIENVNNSVNSLMSNIVIKKVLFLRRIREREEKQLEIVTNFFFLMILCEKIREEKDQSKSVNLPANGEILRYIEFAEN